MSDRKKNYSKSSADIKSEVRRLYEADPHRISSDDMKALRKKYSDFDILERIQADYLEKRSDIKKKAKKFAKLVLEAWGSANYPLHTLLKKAYKAKKKYDLSDAEFQEFRRIYEKQILAQRYPQARRRTTIAVIETNLSRALGTVSTEPSDGMTVPEGDYKTLQKILRLYAETRATHAQVVLQAMTYRDVAYEAMRGTYNSNKNNPACHVHPVVAALFLPKIRIIDEHMLIANISYIVKSRYNKEPIMTKPDYELFYDLISDPNDVVCDLSSPIADLHDRAVLQHHLWNSVLNLRHGRYYDCNNTDFLMAIDNCKVSAFDNPDFMYVNDEGTIMRRLLGAFSFRPTVVMTKALYGTVVTAGMMGAVHMPSVTSVPMITLRLPFMTTRDTNAVNLEDSIDQAQWFLEGGTIVPKNQSIIYSRGVMIFYVPRRTHSINIERLSEPYNFTRLPPTISGFERVNARPVNFNEVMRIGDDTYKLRSVVVVDVNKNVGVSDLIIGNSTAIMTHFDPDTGTNEAYYYYDPRGAGYGVIRTRDDGGERAGTFTLNNPVTTLNGHMDVPNGPESFTTMCRNRGTVFVYALDEATSPRRQGRIWY